MASEAGRLGVAFEGAGGLVVSEVAVASTTVLVSSDLSQPTSNEKKSIIARAKERPATSDRVELSLDCMIILTVCLPGRAGLFVSCFEDHQFKRRAKRTYGVQ